MTGVRATGLIDRDPQNLPIPLGDMAPVRVRRPRRRRALGTLVPAVLLAIGVTSGATGLTLLIAPPPIAVSLVGNHLEAGGMVLNEVGPVAGSHLSRYEGEASYVLAEHGDGTSTAAAAWVSAGITSSGVCSLRPNGIRLIDECVFTGGPKGLTSVDVLDPASGTGWQRTYNDGVRVTIAVSPDGAAVPVPFPIGR